MRLTIEFEKPGMLALKELLTAAVTSLEAQEQAVRRELEKPEITEEHVLALDEYLCNVVIPQRLVAGEIIRCIDEGMEARIIQSSQSFVNTHGLDKVNFV